MRRTIRLIALALMCAVLMPCMLTGCHGAKETEVFQIPDEFDESMINNIVLWAENDIDRTRKEIFGQAISDMLTDCRDAKEIAAFQIPDEFDESREYNIVFWAKNDTNQTQKEIYEQAIRDFEALYPNIHVEMRLYTDYGRIYQDVITNISTGTTPNVCITYPDHIATYNTSPNTVVALDELMTDEEYGLGGTEVRFDAPTVEEIVPKFLAECNFGGHYYALPYMRSTEACYVNKTYVEKLGYELPEVLTWDFIWEVSEAAMAKDEDGNFIVNGQQVMIPFIYKSTDNMMIQMLYQLGADYVPENGNMGLLNDETAEILYTVAGYAATKTFSTFKISSYPGNFMNAGQCIFAVDSTAGATWMGSDAPLIDIPEDKLVDFEMAVLPIPQYAPENPKMISQGPSICIFNKKDSQEVMASWLFVQFMLTNPVQINYSATEGYVPVTLKAQQDPEYVDYLSRAGEDNDLYYDVKINAAKLLLDNMDNTFTTPVFVGSAELRNAAGHLVEDVAVNARRKKTIDETYIETLYADTVTLYHLDEISEGGAGKQELGPLPGTAVALIACLGAAWIGIIAYVIMNAVKTKKLRRGASGH